MSWGGRSIQVPHISSFIIQGTIVGRRVLGNHLAFATILLEGNEELVKVKFWRCLQAGQRADDISVWADDSEAPFPVRKSLLRLGTLVTLDVVQRCANGGPPDVVRWSIVLLSFTTGSGVAANGMFSLPERLQEREKAHRDAMALVSEVNVLELPLCKHWMLTGSCAKNSRGQCPGFRHTFNNAEEEARAQRGRESREKSVHASQLETKRYNDSNVAMHSTIVSMI